MTPEQRRQLIIGIVVLLLTFVLAATAPGCDVDDGTPSTDVNVVLTPLPAQDGPTGPPWTAGDLAIVLLAGAAAVGAVVDAALEQRRARRRAAWRWPS